MVIVSPLDAEWMDEDYRTQGTRLDLEETVEVLPDTFARDPERVARFQRDAKAPVGKRRESVCSIIALGRTRTCNPLVRSQVLYPIELRARYTPSARDGSTEIGTGHYSITRPTVQACGRDQRTKQWRRFTRGLRRDNAKKPE